MLAIFTVDTVAYTGPGSLWDAVAQANALDGPDEIAFAPAMSGAKIKLFDELTISDDLVIDATPLAGGITIDADLDPRLMWIESNADVELRGLTFTRSRGNGEGGVVNYGTLLVESCTFTNNEDVAVLNGGTVTISRSFFYRNSEDVASALKNSGSATIRDSTFAQNGKADFFANAVITTSGPNQSLTIERSTIGGDEVAFDADGQGLSISGTLSAGDAIEIRDSIVLGKIDASVEASYSLLADIDPALVTGVGNLLNVNPQLGPLVDNGGRTPTYALMPGSPALEAGDPDFLAAPGMSDQRGEPYQRLVGRLDMGAYEAQAPPTVVQGDFNADGRVDAADYSIWRNNLGTSVSSLTMGDATGDGLVDDADYRTWRGHYGLVPIGASLIVNSLGDQDDGDIDNGVTTLREAIRFSNYVAWAGTITFDPSLSGGVIEVGSRIPQGGYYQIGKALTIDARMLPDGITLDAGGRTMGMHIHRFTTEDSEDYDVTLAGLTIKNGRGGSGGGGAINSVTSGKLTVIDCQLLDSNASSGTAGAIIARGDVELVDTTIDGASVISSLEASAIFTNGNVTLVRSAIRNVGDATHRNVGINAKPVSGLVGIFIPTVTLIDSEITATESGGVKVTGNVVLERSRIENTKGPGIVAIAVLNSSGVHGGNVTLVDSSVSHNTSLNGSLFEGNHRGGAGILAGNDVELVRSQVENNRVELYQGVQGGGILAIGDVRAFDSSVSGNNAQYGGGIYARGRRENGSSPTPGEAIVSIIGSAVNDNESQSGGAAIHALGSVAIDTSSVSGNAFLGQVFAHDRHAVVLLEVNVAGHTLTIADSVLAGNSALDPLSARVTHTRFSAATIEVIRTHVIDNELNGVTASRVEDSYIARNAGAGILGSRIDISGTTINGNGSGILADGEVRLQDSTVRGNSSSTNVALGQFGPLAAVSGSSVLVERSLIADNRFTFDTTGSAVPSSGGVRANQVAIIVDSTIRDNTVSGPTARGGGVNAGIVQIYGSTISGNSAIGENSRGGGIWSQGTPRLRQSTLSGNRVEGVGAQGGGVWAFGLDAIAGTIVGNSAVGDGAEGGGIYVESVGSMIGSVVANNTATAGAPDLRATNVDPTLNAPGVVYSLVRDPNGSPLATGGGGGGNLLGVDPLLGPLANNGGRTLTHAPLAGSPLIDAGDPAMTSVSMGVGIPNFPGYLIDGIYDQRGEPFDRAVDGGSGTVRIDIGAVEVQPPAAGGASFGAGGLAVAPVAARPETRTPAVAAIDEALAFATDDDLLLLLRANGFAEGEDDDSGDADSPFGAAESDNAGSLAAIVVEAGLTAVDDELRSD